MSKRNIIISTLILLFVFTINIYAEDYPLGFPKANINVENIVSIDLLRKIALDRATETFGQVTPGIEIPCCDLDGSIICYKFVFRLGEEPPASYIEIVNDVIYGRELYAQGLRHMKEDGFSSFSGDSQERVLKARQEYETGKKMQWGIGEYCTVVVSATEDFVPVIEYSEGLPRYYTAGDFTLQKAKESLGTGAELERIYYGGPLDQLYEFSGGSEKVLINPFSLRTYGSEQIQKKKSVRTRIKDQAMENEIKELWRKIRQRLE